jgi:hypothetical protein
MKRGATFAVVAATSACAVALFTAGTAAAASNVAAAPRTTGQLKFLGTVNLKALAASSPATAASPTKTRAEAPLRAKVRPAAAAIRTANPNPTPTPLRFLSGPPQGFVGITAADSGRLNAIDVEPPDQGLCAFGNIVMENVNLALAVY